MTQLPSLFEHSRHPRTNQRLAGTVPPPPTVDQQRVGFNGRIGLFITTVVGTMWAAYLFAMLSLVSLPSALSSGSSIIIVAWIAQTFLQLVLLPVIIVGQNIQAAAADRRAEETYADAEAILHEVVQVQQHLAAQDESMRAELAELKSLIAELRAR